MRDTKYGLFIIFYKNSPPKEDIVKIPPNAITQGSGTFWSQTHGINHREGHDTEDWEQTNKNERATRAGEKRQEHKTKKTYLASLNLLLPQNGSNECQVLNLGVKRQVHNSKEGTL